MRGSLMKMRNAQLYQLIGGELSPYTAKVRSYLRYKNIPFETVQSDFQIYKDFVKPKIGWTVIPVLTTPDGGVVQDSTDMITYLESRHPQVSIFPSSPKQAIVSLLMEMFCDEWMVMPAMHYRWSFPENLPYIKEEFGRIAFPRESTKDRSNAAEMFYGRFKGMLPVLGITKTSGPAIEQSWIELLHELVNHFDSHPYLLGDKPCVGDFSLYGMMYAHLYRDPVPGFIMKTKAPSVAAWVEQMNGHLAHANKLKLHRVTDDGKLEMERSGEEHDFLADDDIAETLYPVLMRFFSEVGPVLLQTQQYLAKYIQENVTSESTKLPRSFGQAEFTIAGITDTRKIFPFMVWKWQRVTDLYRSLAANEREDIDRLMARFPCGLEVIQADLSKCRVARIRNFLHADLSPKSPSLSKL